MDQPICSITSVQMATLTKSLPMDEPQYVEGRVEVVCSNTSREPKMIELGLSEVGKETYKDMPTAASTGTPSNMDVDLFSDGAGRQALPLDASGLKHYSTRHMIPGSSSARLSIPFYARVVAKKLVAAGEYKFTREIGLLFRVIPPL